MFDTILNALITQAPNSVALIIVIVLFLNALEKHDTRYAVMLSELTRQMSVLDIRMSAKIDTLHSAVMEKLDGIDTNVTEHTYEARTAINKINESKKI